ncbi:lysosomal acid glucosylceramidase isoform X2 [Folsomia candida]|uniref:Glucosylceramidase n=1 Tax=Folsomia candida TaxID=158441 RepID=A0A226EMZ2_FOLCA|nr:lysosomal acid glucosylceramidase isoform X2 [Folsomia candida]OXA58161.1 Glucosylceramidase [Folsomia candida]
MLVFQDIWVAILLAHTTIILNTIHCQRVECNPRVVQEDENKIVCVCNETYCDSLGPITLPEKGSFIIYTSNRKGQRLKKIVKSFVHGKRRLSQYHSASPYKIKITVDTSKTRQTVLGFGGAFTDAAGINIASLSEPLQKQLLSSYFGPDGIGYSIGRIPIGGTDFSTRPYTYDDNNLRVDMNLSAFSLQKEDFEYKIPFVKLAQNLEPTLLLYGSPWTAPPWMKTNKAYTGRGMLQKQYFKVWANYIVKFLQEYEKQGVRMWGLTTQNEPIDGLIPFFPFNSMGWTSSMQKDWVKNYFGPILHENGYQDVKVMILDDNTILLPYWAKDVLSDPDASMFVSGIGVHWYTRQLSGYEGVRKTLDLFPDKFILATEACAGFLKWQDNVDLGSWERGEEYGEDIIQELNHGASGWTDWNIALNKLGGPNWVNMGADSPIIVDSEDMEFYKQPMFYILAHFSKFFTRNSEIISNQISANNSNLISSLISGLSGFDAQLNPDFAKNIFAVAALRSDNAVVVGILNKNEFPVLVDLVDSNGGRGTAVFNISEKSMSTILFMS